MANITRYDPFNDLVDDFFKGFLVRPVAYEGRNDVLPRLRWTSPRRTAPTW